METAIRRRAERKRKYGLTDAAFHQMVVAHGNACAICGVTFTAEPNVDHCHETGVVRGLLCSMCNGGLGMFKDREDLMVRAIEYLRRVA